NSTFNNQNVFGKEPVYIQAGDRSGDLVAIQPTTLRFDEMEQALQEKIEENKKGNSSQIPSNGNEGNPGNGVAGTGDSSQGGTTTTTTTTTTEEHTKTVETIGNGQTSSKPGKGGLLGIVGSLLD